MWFSIYSSFPLKISPFLFFNKFTCSEANFTTMSAMLDLTLIFSISALFKDIKVCSKECFFLTLDFISFENAVKTLFICRALAGICSCKY